MNPNKQETYFSHARPRMLEFIPVAPRRVLEVGCGEGSFAGEVKRRTQAEIWGIELDSDAAARAKNVIDHVLIGDADERIRELPHDYFDLIICNDVLEHLINPGQTLESLKGKLVSSGTIVASIPNIRYAWALRDILIRRDFPYQDEGIFDRTHLRFFTRKSMVRLFRESGFEVQLIKGIHPHYRALSILFVIASFGWFADSVFLQYACVATVRNTK
jgi:2-polyprenyl-3-methyl-5-hydroxy-6-metoxy-1,4-benzoquinol methylase